MTLGFTDFAFWGGGRVLSPDQLRDAFGRLARPMADLLGPEAEQEDETFPLYWVKAAVVPVPTEYFSGRKYIWATVFFLQLRTDAPDSFEITDVLPFNVNAPVSLYADFTLGAMHILGIRF